MARRRICIVDGFLRWFIAEQRRYSLKFRNQITKGYNSEKCNRKYLPSSLNFPNRIGSYAKYFISVLWQKKTPFTEMKIDANFQWLAQQFFRVLATLDKNWNKMRAEQVQLRLFKQKLFTWFTFQSLNIKIDKPFIMEADFTRRIFIHCDIYSSSLGSPQLASIDNVLGCLPPHPAHFVEASNYI